MKDYYVYPAIFEYNEDGISISFPDLDGCLTCASTDEEGLYMAKDALGLYLVTLEETGNVPNPTCLRDIEIKKNQKVVLIEINMPIFRDRVQNISIKKTLTIPKWLNEQAEKQNVNFSRVLQNALMEYLNINKK